MKSAAEVEKLKDLLTNTITLLVKNAFTYKAELCVEALIGITLDREDIVLVNIKEEAFRGKHTRRQEVTQEQEDNGETNSGRIRLLSKRKIESIDHGCSPTKQLRISAENSLRDSNSFQCHLKSTINEGHSHAEVRLVKEERSEDSTNSALACTLGQRNTLSCWPESSFQRHSDTPQDITSDRAATRNERNWSNILSEELEEGNIELVKSDDDQGILLQAEGTTRHKSLTKMDLNNITSTTNEKSTIHQTNWAVKTLKDWLVERNYSTDFEHLPFSELAILLRQFYGEVQTARRQEYSKSALCGIRAGIQRHLSNPPFNRGVNIINDSEFLPANKVIMGRIKLNRRLGIDVTTPRLGLNPDDIDRMYQSRTLNNTTAKGLQFKVFFETSIHFGIRGKDVLRDLTKDSFIIREDDNGVPYAIMKYDGRFQTEQSPGNMRDENEKRMYATGDEFCPIHSLRKYLGHLDPEFPHFYQHISKEQLMNDYNGKEQWYNGRPIGVNTLAEFMKNMSIEAKLSKVYTNHCVRTTDFSSYVCATAYGSSNG